jgi:hypothetical protein
MNLFQDFNDPTSGGGVVVNDPKVDLFQTKINFYYHKITFSLLRERDATRGGGSLVLLRGCQRRTATQISMVVLSENTLKVLLESAARDV